MNHQAELLAPAGSEEMLRAVFRAGADAAYIGGARFGARAYAENPDDEALKANIDYAHLHGRRLYLTVNTLLKERELEQELAPFLTPLYRHGLDAVLVQDLGVFSYLRERYPRLPIHISTQMTVAGTWGARMAARMGATRLVLPRELSLKEIKEIREAADVELETFIHGALCYCYSGQCLMSSLIGGRSGNRGRCAQTCRLPMNGRLLMNLKDICTLDILPQILDAGVVSLKIEGRMKSPRYAAGVVSVYRKYLDRLSDSAAAGRSEDRPPKANASSSGRWTVDPADRELLRELFDRGGFSEGYYRCHNGASMIAVNGKPDKRIPDEAMLAPLDRYLSGEITEAVNGRLVLRRGEPARLTVTLPSFAGGLDQGTFTHTALGQVPQTAQNRAATEADVRKQMAKTGGSGYTWSNLEIDMDDDLFLPVSVLNALRRDAFAGLSKEICDAYRRDD